MTKADSLFGPRFGSSLSLNSVRRAELVWADLTYTVVIGRGKKAATKTVLDGVSGVAAPGQLLAVMGPTGARRAGWGGCRTPCCCIACVQHPPTTRPAHACRQRED